VGDNEQDESVDVGENKTFLAHLEDLRWMLVKIFGALAVAMAVCFIYRKEIVRIYLIPLKVVTENPESYLKSFGVMDPLSLSMQIAFYAGVIFALPLLLYFIGEFVLPALSLKEKKMISPVFFMATFLFLLGVAFAYFWLLPITLQFMFNDSKYLGFEPSWAVMEYFSFVSSFVVSFGLAFELPVIVLILNHLGILPARILSSGRRYAVLIIVIFAAIITPGSDLFSLVALSIPLYFLYELSIIVAIVMEKRKGLRSTQNHDT